MARVPQRVLGFGTYDSALHPRVAVLLTGLREHGLPVSECNEPLGLSTADKVRVLKQPWRLPRELVRVLGRWSALTRRARSLPAPDVVVVGYLGHVDVLLARRLFRRAIVVLDLLVLAGDTARDRGAGRWRQRLLTVLDRVAVRASDVVVVDTEEHRALLPAARRQDGVVVPVGAAPEWFAAATQRTTGPLRVVFFGLFTPLQGTPTLARALTYLADDVPCEVTLVGGGQDEPEVRRLLGDHPRLNWHAWVAADELPALVAAHDVCLGIFGTGDKARRVVPNKVFQGAAAGCALVTSDTPPQRRALGDAAVFVPAGDAHALARALTELARDPGAVARLARLAHERALNHFTATAVTEPLVARLLSVPARAAA